MSFNVSDKVVYVGPIGKPRGSCVSDHGQPALVKGRVYVVRDVWTEPRSVDGWLIHLAGYPEIYGRRTGRRLGFIPSVFRKLDEIKAENAAKIEAEVSA